MGGGGTGIRRLRQVRCLVTRCSMDPNRGARCPPTFRRNESDPLARSRGWEVGALGFEPRSAGFALRQRRGVVAPVSHHDSANPLQVIPRAGNWSPRGCQVTPYPHRIDAVPARVTRTVAMHIRLTTCGGVVPSGGASFASCAISSACCRASSSFWSHVSMGHSPMTAGLQIGSHI